jgi:hypothetical protein
MQDTDNDELTSSSSVEYYMRALHHTAIVPADVAPRPSRFRETSELAEAFVEPIHVADHLGIAPYLQSV